MCVFHTLLSRRSHKDISTNGFISDYMIGGCIRKLLRNSKRILNINK